jgi:flagellar basal body-associated protein FliL
MKQKNILIIILTILVVLLTLAITALLVKCDSQSQAINAVDNYIEETADTGQMDEFLMSPQGRTYIEHTK